MNTPNLHGVYRMDLCVPKKDLKHGVEYTGHCRNATKAVWDAEKERFAYQRTKWGHTFTEYINHPEDDAGYDLFVPWRINEH